MNPLELQRLLAMQDAAVNGAQMPQVGQQPSLAQQGQPGADEDPMEYLLALQDDGLLEQSLTPFAQQDEALQQQMAKAAALRGQRAPQRGTPIGQALSGLSDIVNNVGGAFRESELQGEQQGLMRNQQLEAAKRMASALKRYRGRGQVKAGGVPDAGIDYSKA